MKFAYAERRNLKPLTIKRAQFRTSHAPTQHNSQPGIRTPYLNLEISTPQSISPQYPSKTSRSENLDTQASGTTTVDLPTNQTSSRPFPCAIIQAPYLVTRPPPSPIGPHQQMT